MKLLFNGDCLFQALGDIQIAIKALQDEEESLEHPVDKHYKTLHCAMTPLDREHDDFKVFTLNSTLHTCVFDTAVLTKVAPQKRKSGVNQQEKRRHKYICLCCFPLCR